ncbi:Acetyltransferase (GNAT) domain-containing protein [Palleronia marisminoris]|uniref:Acetyltransferase (GNAT) family protein n=1 Tax=Palleronia marisminoris TaxID=315423 RepID=A0A1Y5TCP9_9RHOB|nr:GNAT family N-acetyltransferase [Palleronia marisminoris]SFH32743.1 Acetyltransferase (GNAT) domain-containing protein [Palleronia marisminoris]SLN60993.1 Acetyltransferase (GNAT) family protein [Palleronia marisminoris]
MLDPDPTPITEGTYAVPAGHLAVVVHHLTCTTPLPPRKKPKGLVLRREKRMYPNVYRELFRMVGRDWLWTSRLMIEDDALLKILLDPGVAIFTLHSDDGPMGMVELDIGDPTYPEISFFGLVPAAMGQGVGGWLMSHVLQTLFDGGAEKVRLNTCTLDSPQALRFYLRVGFKAERREVRVFPDPRAVGLLDEDAAPFVPRL